MNIDNLAFLLSIDVLALLFSIVALLYVLARAEIFWKISNFFQKRRNIKRNRQLEAAGWDLRLRRRIKTIEPRVYETMDEVEDRGSSLFKSVEEDEMDRIERIGKKNRI